MILSTSVLSQIQLKKIIISFRRILTSNAWAVQTVWELLLLEDAPSALPCQAHCPQNDRCTGQHTCLVGNHGGIFTPIPGKVPGNFLCLETCKYFSAHILLFINL